MNLSFEAIAKWDNENAFAALKDGNALFQVNMINGECIYISMFNEDLDKDRLFTSAYKIGGKIYFIPYRAQKIAVYEPQKENLYDININSVDKEKYQFYKKNAKFNSGVIVGKYLYIIPCTYPAVIRIDSENDEIVYFSDWVGDGKFDFRKRPLLVENKIYIPSVKNNKLLKFDVENNKGEIIILPTKYGGWWSMCKIGNDFWLSPKLKGPIICWNEKNNTIVEYGQYPKEFKESSFNFTICFENNDNVVFLPVNGNVGIIVNIKNKTLLPWIIKEDNGQLTFLYEYDDKIYIQMKNKMMTIGKNDLEVGEFSIDNPKNMNQFYMDYGLRSRGNIIRENQMVKLEDFVQMI